LKHLSRFDVYRRLVLAILGMEVRRRMVTPVHVNRDSVECTDPRHWVNISSAARSAITHFAQRQPILLLRTKRATLESRRQTENIPRVRVDFRKPRFDAPSLVPDRSIAMTFIAASLARERRRRA
jgi:hypothetical protein